MSEFLQGTGSTADVSGRIVPARRKKQPTADAMREQLALAASEVIRLRERLAVAEMHAGQILAAGIVAGMFLAALLGMLK